MPDLRGRRLTVRADGDANIGTGHLMRCLAIASAWVAAGGRARLACCAIPDGLAARYAEAGVEVERRADWSAREVAEDSHVVVVDQPWLDDGVLVEIAAQVPALVTVDDMAARERYPGSVVLNPNAHASAALYTGRTDARLCLGPRWSLLRQGFAERREPDRPARDPVRKILALLGGADPKGFSVRVLVAAADAAARLDPAPTVTLVVGAANPSLDDLRHRAAALPGPVEVRHDVRDMPALMDAADMAVSAAASTALELAALGVPAILAAQNETETGPGTALQEHGAALYLGPFDGLGTAVISDAIAALARDAVRRQSMREAGMRLVDGHGVGRLLALLAGPTDGQPAQR